MSNKIEFRSGDKVVYPTHGVGEIRGNEKQEIAGEEIKLYVIFFEKDKMTLRVPFSTAKRSGLRKLSTLSEVKLAVGILKSRAKVGRGMWSRRAQEYESKINSGMMSLIAEVVRDLHKNVDDPDRSYSERIIYESALGRLAGEFSAVKKISQDDAIEDIKSVLLSRRATSTTENSEDEVANENDIEIQAIEAA